MYKSGNLDKNNKKMIGNDMVISYKVDTNYLKNIVKSREFGFTAGMLKGALAEGRKKK